jgi:hypothetical protein
MSVIETSKLLAESRKIVDPALVSSIDNRLHKVENCLGKFEEMKNIITSLNN